MPEPRFLLMQARKRTDPMRTQEVGCFARALDRPAASIVPVDMLKGPDCLADVARFDAVLIGGSGDYSVVEGGPWLGAALEVMRRLCDETTPIFASCFGFQAIALALGGEVRTDLTEAEVGSIDIDLTPEAADDDIFRHAPPTFKGQSGHQDIVKQLPPEAVHLASGPLSRHEAFRLEGRPIYATQFHPELDSAALLQRVEAYPEYIERITGESYARFCARVVDTPEAEAILRRFVATFVE